MEKILKTLQKLLKVYYPPHHYKHVEVWTKFWALADIIKEK